MSDGRRIRKQRDGFTLIEVLIVVVILGILAATVLPQFTRATEDAKEAALKQNLQALRSQIELYKYQHGGQYPSTDFVDQMTQRTDEDGNVDETEGPYGPYIVGQLPPNPFNNLRTVKTDGGNVDESTGWIYDPATGRIWANSEGLASDEVTELSAL